MKKIMRGGEKMNRNEKNKIKFAVVEITPANLACAAAACPSIFETKRGTYILVGKKLGIKDVPGEVKSKMGAGETAMEIPKELITKLFSKE